MLARLFKGNKKESLWDHFINTPPADPKGDLGSALTGASEGRMFPVKSHDPDPAAMALNVKDLAKWWGADLVGIVGLEPGSLYAIPAPAEPATSNTSGFEAPPFEAGPPEPDMIEPAPPDRISDDATTSDSDEERSEAGGALRYLFGIVCAYYAEYDPDVSKGIGGRYVIQRGGMVNQHIGAFIREVGFRATKCKFDPLPLAELAGLGKVDKNGRFVTQKKVGYVHVAQVIVTTLPMTADTPAR